MAILSVTEQWGGRSGGIDESGNFTFKRRWLVTSDTDTESIVAVSAAVPVAYYAPHPDYAAARARSTSITPGEGPRVWQVEINYSSAPIANARPADGGPPTVQDPAAPQQPTEATNSNKTPAQSRPAEWSFTRKELKVAAEYDRNGDPIKNSAGDPIEGIELDRSHLVATIKYWSVNLTVDHIQLFWNKTNSLTYRGFPPRTLLVQDFNYKTVYETIAEGVVGMLYEVQIVLEVNFDEWRLKVLDAGLREKDSSGKMITITDAAGNPVSSPWPLLESGQKWTSVDTYHYLYFDIYGEADFAGLIV